MQKYIVLLVLLATLSLQSASNKKPVTCYIFNGGTTYSQEQHNGMQLTATHFIKHKSYSSSECKLELSINNFLEHNIGDHRGKIDYMHLRELYLQQQKDAAAESAATGKKKHLLS